jgi:hypothetical protein
MGERSQRQKSGNESSEIPAETPYFASYRNRAVCKDWEMLTVELARLEELTFAHFEVATKGDVPATMALKWISEHRAAIGGLYASVAVRSDPYQVIEQSKQPSTTDRIQAVLDALAKPRPIDQAGSDEAAEDQQHVDHLPAQEAIDLTLLVVSPELSGTDADTVTPANGMPDGAPKDWSS